MVIYFSTYIERNTKLDSISMNDKWSLMDEVIFHLKAVNLEHLKKLIILIHKCVDGKCSNYIYYTVRLDLLSESAMQTEEIISTSNMLK